MTDKQAKSILKKHIRQRGDMSRIAELLGVHRNTVSRWCAGQNVPIAMRKLIRILLRRMAKNGKSYQRCKNIIDSIRL